MRKTTTTILAAAAAIPLAFLTASPAAAAPGDITPAFTANANPGGGNSVTGTFTSTSGVILPGYCFFQDRPQGDDENYIVASSYETVGLSLSATDTDVPAGTYTIDWGCYTPEGIFIESTVGSSATAEPSTLVVPAVVPEEPEVPEPGCTGSVCLPTGSAFGF